MPQRTCKQCGAEIAWFERTDKKFCDANCRKRWSRRKDKYLREAAKAKDAIMALQLMALKNADLRREIDAELKRLGDYTLTVDESFDNGDGHTFNR